jgi:general stress protein YciG
MSTPKKTHDPAQPGYSGATPVALSGASIPEAASSEARPKQRRGFACIDPERRREIARKGGRAAHAAGTAHQFTSDEARAAGKKGGTAPHVRRGRGPGDKPAANTETAQ